VERLHLDTLIGRPHGPVRAPPTVRILAEHNELPTSEVALHGVSPRYTVPVG
jgi:hypothetical protein